jgi:hypothetical protein
MHGWRSSARLGALVLLAGCVVLGGAAAARSAFSAVASGGPLLVSTASLAAPSPPTASVWSCRFRRDVTVLVSWNVQAHVDGVELLRASSPAGPFVPILQQPPGSGHYFDTTEAFSSTLYYAVRTIDGNWHSPRSAATKVDLPDQRCR